MKRSLLLIVAMTAMMFVVCSAYAWRETRNRIAILIVDGFSNHDWKQTTRVTKWILEESGLFTVDVSTIPLDSVKRNAWLSDFTKYAVVIQNTNNIWEPTIRWPRAAEKALEEFVASGGGLYILHSANNAFSHWKEYDRMIGLGWRPKSNGYGLEIDQNRNLVRIAPGDGEGTGHGDRFNALIQIFNDHQINKGFPREWQTVNTEVYYFPRGAAQNLTVLSYAYDSTGTHRMWPTEWAVAYGKGRVYNSSLGHLWKGEIYPQAYRCAGYQTVLIRATEWLATGNVTYPVPSDFPTAGKPSLRRESDYLSENKDK